MKNQKTWVAVILLGTVAVNAGAYLMVRSRRAAPPEPVATRLPTPTPAVAPPSSEPPPSEDANAGVIRALRASGLAALEDRDYGRAVAQFTEALKLLRPDDKDSDLTRLLGIATDLRSREQSKPAQAPTPREPAPGRTPPRTRAAKLAAARAAREQQATPAAAQEEARGGLLLVTSTPPGLVVMVDGRAVDMTPARLTVSAGAHRVVLAQGDRRLYEETVEVDADSVRSLNRDLTAELTPPAPKPAVAPVAAVVPASPPSAGTPVAAPRDPEPAKPPEPSVANAAVAQRGDLEVTSPGLYGEVWINGRPYGFPPISAQALPSGPAKVEVRVNGEVKRRMTVEVEPGRSTRVRVK
ncbi:PEGA domain-containing protein [Corallococcus sp. AS-1-6]|uniref:PEGA domain-containing protein n=1 Tax=Corallococcus sp. AS-1-6 TaxID=2874599 RepID=UPI001CBA930A|nr:PEGA domain-containing protein [Corallococcus sp. AS-1-6]